MVETKAVIEVLARETSQDPCTLTPQTSIRGLAVDSLGMMNVMFGLEEITGVELQAEDMTGVTTVGDLVLLLNQKSAAQERQG